MLVQRTLQSISLLTCLITQLAAVTVQKLTLNLLPENLILHLVKQGGNEGNIKDIIASQRYATPRDNV